MQGVSSLRRLALSSLGCPRIYEIANAIVGLLMEGSVL